MNTTVTYSANNASFASELAGKLSRDGWKVSLTGRRVLRLVTDAPAVIVNWTANRI